MLIEKELKYEKEIIEIKRSVNVVSNARSEEKRKQNISIIKKEKV